MKFKWDGMEDLQLSFEKMAQLPDEVKDQILTEQSDYVVEKLKQRGEGYGVGAAGRNDPFALTQTYEGGGLLKSIKAGKPKRGKDGNRKVTISARGKNKISGTKNDYVAFLNNYGSRHNKAKPFWTDTMTVEAKSETLTDIAKNIYDQWLKSLNL